MRTRLLLASALGALLAIAPAVSAAPVAEARGNEFLTRYVEVGRTVTLDGSGSYGADCNLSYSWTMISRPASSGAGISAPTSVQPTFTPDRVGDYVIDLVVADSSGTSSPARMTVSAINGSGWPLPAKNADRWMSLTPKLMDRTLPQITLPGTHDSGAYWLDRCDDESCRGPDFIVFSDSWEWIVDDEYENEIAYDVARAHDQDLLAQLQGGIRYFDLRVTWRNGVFYVYHGLLGRPLTDVLSQIRSFLDQSEHELVTAVVSHLRTGTNSGNKKDFTAAQHQQLMQLLVDDRYLGPYLYSRNGQTTRDLLATPLGQIVGNGPRVLLVYGDDYYYKCKDGVCDFGPARADPHFERFWHQSFATGSYTDTVRMFDGLPCPRDDAHSSRGQYSDQLCNARLHTASLSPRGFTLFQTLTANDDVAKRSFCWHVWSPACIFIDRDAGPSTLHQLSQVVNPFLPSLLGDLPLRPSVILADFYEESAVVSEAIRLNQRDTKAPTGQATRYPPANRYGGSFGDVTVTLTAADEPGGSGVGGLLVTTEGAQTSSGEYCGARKEVVIKAKGTTTVKYRPWDREGNMPEWRSLVVRTDKKCDFNRDGKTDAADRSGLLNSVRDKSIMFLGDLNEDGRYTSREWIRCWDHLYRGRPL